MEEEDNLMSSPVAPPFSPITTSSPISVTVMDDVEQDVSEWFTESASASHVDSESVAQEWCGFKVVGDNVDKNIRPSFQRYDRQTLSLHYFHSYAIKDRVNLQSCSDLAPTNPSIDGTTLIPSEEDIGLFTSDAEILVARLIVTPCN